MARGGYRENAGGKPTWNLGKTTTIRVPIALAEQLRQIARKLDNNFSIAKIDTDTESKVLNLSNVPVFQLQNRPYVFVHDLIMAGYEIRPMKLAKMAKSELGGSFSDGAGLRKSLIQPKRE